MRPTTLRAALAAILLGGAALVAAPGGESPTPAPAPRAAAGPVLKGPNKLVFWREGALVTIDPDGKNARTVKLAGKCYAYLGGKFSPDGTTVAALVHPTPFDGSPPGTTRAANQGITKFIGPSLHVRRWDEEAVGTDLGVVTGHFSWSPDGTEIACRGWVGDPRKRAAGDKSTNLIVNVRTKATRAHPIPPDHTVVGWAPGGKSFLTVVSKGDPLKHELFAGLYLVNPDGTVRTALTGEADYVPDGAFSPSGTRLLYARARLVPETPAQEKQRLASVGGPERAFDLVVHDLATDRVTTVSIPDRGRVLDCCWSPDGARIAYTWQDHPSCKTRVLDILEQEVNARVIVSDPDGRNRQTVAEETGNRGKVVYLLGGVNWR